jgi:hypothetical protein
MDNGIQPGLLGGPTFNNGTNPHKDGVQYGPNAHKIEEDPAQTLIKKTNGKSASFFEPNGIVEAPVENFPIEYLKS